MLFWVSSVNQNKHSYAYKSHNKKKNAVYFSTSERTQLPEWNVKSENYAWNTEINNIYK